VLAELFFGIARNFQKDHIVFQEYWWKAVETRRVSSMSNSNLYSKAESLRMQSEEWRV
jgi:hypothetical protein